MPATVTQAVDDVLGLVNTTWTTDVVPLGFQALVFDDNPESRPLAEVGGDVANWGRVLVRHFGGTQASLAGATGTNRYVNTGAATLSIWARQDTGRTLIDQVAELMMAGLRGKSTTNGVIFRDVILAEVGADGVWFAASIIANFEYDQIQ